jgi:ribosomal protein S18 acetylase RimI-like enzyme
VSGVSIRRATTRDLDAVVTLRLALLREYPDHPIYGRLRPDAEMRARPVFEAQLESDNEVIFLAEHDGRAVGLLRCVDTVASTLLMPDRYCYVSSVYVHPRFRRRGVLTALLDCAREWCARRGLSEMRLHNVGSRASAAAAWDAAGFEVVEQLRVLRLDATPTEAAHHHADAPARARHADEHNAPPA